MSTYPLKLVRDETEAAVGGGTICYGPTDLETHKCLLRRKLIEEAIEYLDDPCHEELADVLQVVVDLARIDLDSHWSVVAEVAKRKAEKRGVFQDGIVMSIQKDG